jgi:hypothetical protein
MTMLRRDGRHCILVFKRFNIQEYSRSRKGLVWQDDKANIEPRANANVSVNQRHGDGSA